MYRLRICAVLVCILTIMLAAAACGKDGSTQEGAGSADTTGTADFVEIGEDIIYEEEE